MKLRAKASYRLPAAGPVLPRFKVMRVPAPLRGPGASEATGWLRRHRRFNRLHDYLRAKAGGHDMPGRQDIDPLEIPDLLPYLMMVDVDSGGPEPRFRFRLIGTEFVDSIGRELTGRWMDEVLMPEHLAPAAAMCGAVVRERAPSLWLIHNPVGSESLVFECALFPLSSDRRTVDLLLAVHTREDESFA